MDWTVRPLNTTHAQTRTFQVQGPYQSQQPASGFSQENVSPQNSSTSTKTNSSTDNMVANQLPAANTMGSNRYQPLLLRTTVPVIGFGTAQHFVGHNAGSHMQPSSMTIQMTSGTAKNAWPNSNVHIFSPVTPQHSTGNPAQQPLIRYTASDVYSNHLKKNSSNSIQASVFQGNKNRLHSKPLPKYTPPNFQTKATVPLNQVSSHFLKSQQNSSCLTFPSGQNIKNQINEISSGSTTAMQSQQYAPNSVYSSPYSVSINYVGQVIPQATNVNFPPPKYPVLPTQINHGQLVCTQPVSNMSNENVQNLMLDESSVACSVQHAQMTPASVPNARESNEAAVHEHKAESPPSDELIRSAVEALRSLCNSLEKDGTLPLDKMSTPQTIRVTGEGNVAESSGNVLDGLTEPKPITRESLQLERQKICELTKKCLKLQAAFKLKCSLFLSAAQKSECSVPNPNLSLPSSNTNQNQPVMLSQASHQTLPAHEAMPNLASLLLHDNDQNQPSSLPCSSNQIQDRSLLLLRTKKHLYPILQELLKGTSDEEMLLNTHVASTEKNQSKQLFVGEKHPSGSLPVSSVNGTQNASKLSPKMSETVFTQESLTCSLGFEKSSASNKDQSTNVSAASGGDSYNHFVLNKNEVGTATTKILTNTQNPVSVQNPAVSSESLHGKEKVAEGSRRKSEDFQNFKSCPEFIQQSKEACLQIPEQNITPFHNGSDISSSTSLAAAVPEAAIVEKTSVTGNSTAGRTCSLEELETSLALWRKSPAASLSDQLSESTKSTMNSSLLDRGEANKIQHPLKNFPNALMHNEKSSIAVGNSEAPLSSSLGPKLDAVSSSSLKSSEPQVAIVPPLILSNDGGWNEQQEKNQSSVLETIRPVVEENSVFSLHDFSLRISDIDKPVERIAYSPSDTCITVKKEEPDMYQKAAKTTEETGIQKAETRPNCSYDPLEMKKNTPPIFSPGTNNGSSSPVSEKCAPESSPDLAKLGDTVLNDNMFQISSVCTLVQGDAFYNSQIASIFGTSSLKSKVENNTSSEDRMPDSYHKEQEADLRKKEMNESTSVQDALLSSVGTLSKAIAEKLLSLPGLKMPQGGKVSHEMNIRDSEKGKITYLPKGSPNSGKEPEQNTSCDDVHSTDLASGNQDVPENKCLFSDDNENSTHGIQEYVPNTKKQAHSLNNTEFALTLPNDQLTELVKEFPYGIDNPQALKNIENEDSASKLAEQKGTEEIQTSGHNSEANDTLDQIVITILNSQQRKVLFPDYSCQSSNKLDSRENNHLSVASADTNNLRENESHVQPDQAVLVKSTNTSVETVKNPAFCCLTGWLSSKYALDPCTCMLAKEATLKQQLDGSLLSESISKEGPETDENSNAHCRLNNQQQSIYPISLPFSEKLEPLIHKNKEQGIEELPDKVQIDETCNQKCKTLVSVSQELLCSRTDGLNGESIRPPHKKELQDNEKTPRETTVDRAKKDTVQLRNWENKQSNKIERYKIKQDSSETHIIKGPIYHVNKRLKWTANEKHNTFKRPCSTVTNSSNLSSSGSLSKTYDNVQHAQEHLSKQKCETERDLESNQAVSTEHNKSSNSEPVQQSKGNFARPNLKKFAYSEERGNVWKYRRSFSANSRTSKVQTHRGQRHKIHKLYSVKDPMWGTSKKDKCFERTISDTNSPCSRKGNTLTLQRDQKKNYLNKVAFKQTAESICLTKLEQSPPKSVWHVKSSRTLEYPEDPPKGIQSSQQSEVVKPQMLEFKMCPDTVFRNLVSEDVPDTKKVPGKEMIPVSGVKSKREDWLHYNPLKRKKTEEKESQVDDQIPLDTALELLEKNEAVYMPVKASNATFQTYRKMHLEKRSRSLDSSPQN